MGGDDVWVTKVACLKVPCIMEESSGVGCTMEMYGKCSVVDKSGWKSMVEVVKMRKWMSMKFHHGFH